MGVNIAVSEASWFTDDRPAELDRYWKDAYPGIDTVANKVAQLQKAGFIPTAVFILPESCWTDHFYAPQVAVQENFLKKHEGNAIAGELVANQRHEAELYCRYKEYYGYAFYVGRKI